MHPAFIQDTLHWHFIKLSSGIPFTEKLSTRVNLHNIMVDSFVQSSVLLNPYFILTPS